MNPFDEQEMLASVLPALHFVRQNEVSAMGDNFWDKRATVLAFHASLHAAQKQGKSIEAPAVSSSEELYLHARNAVGHVSFEEECLRRGIDQSLYLLDARHASMAVAIGALGAGVAVCTDLIGRHVESELFSKFDQKNPADYLKGFNHRYYFGHDLLNPLQELPSGFKLGGRDVGGRSLWTLMADQYGSSSSQLLRFIQVLIHFAVHYFKDLLTTTGIPLPGTSYFTRWQTNIVNACGFSRSNPIMDALRREYGSVHMSDFTSLGLIELLYRGYVDRTLGAVGARFDADVLRGQIATLSYGTCLLTQLGLLAQVSILQPALATKFPGAKLNYVVGGLFVKHALSLVRLVHTSHKAHLAELERSIQILSDPSLTMEDWIKTL